MQKQLIDLVYLRNIPHSEEAQIVTCANDADMLAFGNAVEESSGKEHITINETHSWRIKLNEMRKRGNFIANCP